MIPLPTSAMPSDYPPDPGIRFKNIELEINSICDLACFGCDRFSDVTTAPNMTVAQVSRFVDESLELGWDWERIRLLGGEPTLHPQLKEIAGEIQRYKHRFRNVFVQVLSNGRGKWERERHWLTRIGFNVHVEGPKVKGVTPNWFTNTRIVPLDRNPTVITVPPCGIFDVRGCGIGLTRHGYFLDGAGASIARVAGYDIGVMALKDLTWDAMLDQAKVLCRVCGHWNPSNATIVEKVTKTGQVTGKFWTETLEKYKATKPTLSIYGG
jgi:hypothetical protein